MFRDLMKVKRCCLSFFFKRIVPPLSIPILSVHTFSPVKNSLRREKNPLRSQKKEKGKKWDKNKNCSCLEKKKEIETIFEKWVSSTEVFFSLHPDKIWRISCNLSLVGVHFRDVEVDEPMAILVFDVIVLFFAVAVVIVMVVTVIVFNVVVVVDVDVKRSFECLNKWFFVSNI